MTMADRVRELVISETGFVFDPVSGATFSANGSARLILDALREGRTPAQIVAILQDEFKHADRGNLGHDLFDFLRVFHGFGLTNDSEPQREEQR